MSGKAKETANLSDEELWKLMRQEELAAIRKEQKEERKNEMKYKKIEDMGASPPWKSKSFIKKPPSLKRQDSDDDDIWGEIGTKRIGVDEYSKAPKKYRTMIPEDEETGKQFLKRLRDYDAALLIGSVVRGRDWRSQVEPLRKIRKGKKIRDKFIRSVIRKTRKGKKHKIKETGKSKANRTHKRKQNKKKKNKKRKQNRNKTNSNKKTKNNKTRKKSKK
jgi:hypothetical protein